jgi:hypothetical protein
MPETLDKIFDIENVEPDDALRMKMTGNPQKDITDNIVPLLTTLGAGGKLGGDKRIGQILGAVGALTGRDKLKGPMPPPSVQPLPWAPLPDRPAQQTQPQTQPQPMQPAQPRGTIGQPAPQPGQPAPAPAPEKKKKSDRDALIDLGGQLLQDVLKDKPKEPAK